MNKKKKLVSKRIYSAMDFAVKSHYRQARKGTRVPYFVHPLGVGKILIECGCSEDVVIAGILHDTLEDPKVPQNKIVGVFGKNVLRLVKGASEPNKTDKWKSRTPNTWKARKKHTIKYLKDTHEDVLLVSCADKLDNVRAMKYDYDKIGKRLWQRFNTTKNDIKWYYQALAAEFLACDVSEPAVSLIKEFAYEVEYFFGKRRSI